ncbi:MAG: tetratricopeptide repeat protein [Candidatus Tectomicrobia bacterium]|uniref:Tetratricopeptide repeat protein n=1 Tax=Tectimicrobiota bacterium TaxID=2528274 RepID=A0A932HZG4_UNCTE|nr:tetratricopeptide repeat protein [Candidatus Tectomicrobia bacterium]
MRLSAGLGLAAGVLWLALASGSSSAAPGKETPPEVLHFGLSAFRDGLYDPAIEAFRGYIARWPAGQGAASARYYLAEAYRRRGKPAEALAAYQEFAARHPRDARVPEARLMMGELLEKKGDRAGALQAYASIKEGPLRPEALHRTAALHVAAGEWMGAARALGEFRRLAPRDPRQEAAAYDHALALDRAGRPEEAEAAIREVLEKHPHNPRATEFRRRHGFILLGLGRPEAAERAFEALFRAAPSERHRADVRLGHAASLMGQKKHRQAAGVFEGVLAFSPSAGERRTAERGAAAAWWEAGEFARAASAYRRMAASSGKEALPRYIASLDRAGQCGGEKGRESLRYVLGALERGADLAPPDRLRLGDCLAKAGMDGEAAAQWEALVKAAPASEEGLWAALRRAGLLERGGKPKEAMAAYAALAEAAQGFKGEKEKAAEPLRQAALRGAFLHYGADDCAGALGLLKSLPRDAVPEESRAELASLRAECAFRAKRWEEAEVYYEQVLLGARRPELAARARLQLAAAAEAKGDRKLAIRRVKEALPLLPPEAAREARLAGARLLRGEGDPQGAREMLLPFAEDEKGDPERRREAWLFLAREAAGREDWKEADRALTRWRGLSPADRSEGLGIEAKVRWREGRCPEASEAARQALAGPGDNPERGELRRIVAACLLREGKFAEAVPALEEVTRLEPQAPDAAFELAQALDRAGEARRAEAAYADYLDRFRGEGRWQRAALRLGYLRLAEGREGEALEAFRLAAGAEAPEVRGPARYEVARSLEASKPKAALDAYEKLVAEGTIEAEWRRNAAWRAAALRERAGEWKEALALYRRLAQEKAGGEGESRQAHARAERIEAYLKQAEEREEKMRTREPLFR